MKKVIFCVWVDVSEISVRVLSNDLFCKGDITLDWDAPIKKWTKAVLLLVQGGAPDGTHYRVGFIDHYGERKICLPFSTKKERRVGDGPYLMRIGPRNCHFFVEGEAGPLYLIQIGNIYYDINSKSPGLRGKILY